ncbi:GNAT family N-acetyltransferase [Adlercreutzia sp. ZJ141]|uniref:GNAT family N-acetyltransferase n=1 Tax=Adlercreutzia sp. ZJ141 TaxID=2709406 RepID=UPI0013ED5291|nr:N-acetyltransferase [Adlercreutzia sp. ZJ141]
MDGELTLRVARAGDTERVLDFYTQMIDQMAGTDFDVLWKHDVHPSSEFLRASVDAGQVLLGLLVDGSIVCALVMNREGAPGYDSVPWLVPAASGEVLVLHVVATLPAYHGRGFAKQLVKAAICAAREQGARALRLDTFTTNVRGQRLYETCGFTRVGTFPVFYDDLGTVNLVMYEFAL